MVKIDKTEWPLVQIEVDGLLTLPDMEAYNREMDALLAFAEERQETYGILYVSDLTDEDSKRKRDRDAQKLSVQWLKANKARVGEHCGAIAMVMPNAGAMFKMMRPIAKRSMKRMMGAPGDMFTDLAEGEEWVRGQIG